MRRASAGDRLHRPVADIIRAQAGNLVSYRNMRAEIVRIKGGGVRRSVVKDQYLCHGYQSFYFLSAQAVPFWKWRASAIVDEASARSRTSRIVGSAGSRAGTGNQCSPSHTSPGPNFAL